MQTAQRISTDYKMSKAEDVKSIMAYSHYLIMKAQLIGNLCFDGHKPSEEESRVAEQCRIMCGKIARNLEVCKVNEIPDLLENYDIAYRIGNKSLPDNSFIGRHKQRLFRAWKADDRNVPESSIFGIIAPEVSFRPENADREYIAAYHSIKEKWIATLSVYDRFPEVSAYENYQRLAFITRENLDTDLGQDAENAKRR